MMTEGKHQGDSPEGEDAALWSLLERAPRPKPVSPYFARRVLREVALLEKVAAGESSNWLARTWLTLCHRPSVTFACVLVAAAFVTVGGMSLSTARWHLPVAISQPEPATVNEESTVPPDAVVEIDADPQPTVAVVSEPIVTAQDVEVIADLDNLLSREESRLWTEDDTVRF